MNEQLPGGVDVEALSLQDAILLWHALKQKVALFGETQTHEHLPYRPRHDYESWDWGKDNITLAAEHGVCDSTVAKYRRLLGHPHVQHTKHYPACLEWDWSKSDTAIAREQVVSLNTVRQWRQKLGKPPPPRDYKRIPNVSPLETTPWDKADWVNQADVEIARVVGCTRERVRQKRAELGLPKRLKWTLDWERYSAAFPGIKELSFREFREKFPHTAYNTFRKWAAGTGIIAKRSPHVTPWDQINFDLPNAVLKDIWQLKSNRAAQRRCDYHLQKPAFRSEHGSIPLEWGPVIEAEKAKAAAWLAFKNGEQANQPKENT